MECGVACLTAVLRWFGLAVSMPDVERRCAATNEGASLLGISKAAESYGLDTVTARLSLTDLADSPLPALLHWNQNHFVTLFKVSRSATRFHVADPAKGHRVLSVADMERSWLGASVGGQRKGIALFLQPGAGFEAAGGASYSGARRSLRFLLGYVRSYRSYFVQIMLGLLLGCVFQLVLPFLTQAIVDHGIARKAIGFIWLIMLGEFMIVAGRTATDFIRRWLLLHISMRVNISLVSDFLVKLMTLPMSFFDTKLMGDLVQRMSDHTRVQTFLTSQLLNTVFSLLSMVVFGVVLAMYDWRVFAVFVGGSALYAGWLLLFMRRRKMIDYELFEHQSRNHNRTYQLITALQEIKLQGCEQRRRWEWEDVQADLFGVEMKALRLQQGQEAGGVFINELKNILITVLAATAVVQGSMSLGAMLAVQYIVGQLNSPMQQLVSLIYSMQDVKISLERINDIHQRGSEPTDGLRSMGADRSIELRNVKFSYNPYSPRPTLDNVSFSAPCGKTTAIVGASGSGKTTLLKLMLGYYPVASGELEVAGVGVGEYDCGWWRQQCGVVMQDGVIFSESIARNIAVGDGEVDHDRLRQAARLACLDTYVDSLPLKYETRIGPDGVGLSQGQKQRVLIARAVYKQPHFIMLDEATNSLDAANERAIVGNLRDFFEGRTVIVVAHRLSTVKNADNIVVLDKGKVVEQGTHSELIVRRGTYYNLVKNQLELGN